MSKQLISQADKAVLTQLLGASPQILVAESGPDGILAALRDFFAIKDERGWQAFRWIDVQLGGWSQDQQAFYYQLIDQKEPTYLGLDAPARFVPAFAERVNASIVYQYQLNDDAGKPVCLVVARRQPGSDEELSWQVLAQGSQDLQEPQWQAKILAVKADYQNNEILAD